MKEYTKNLGKVVMTPKGAWSIEKEYEILDIVHDSVTDHAYISKQEVPVGVDLSDSRYWTPLNVSGYSDSNVITLNSFNEDGEIQSYTLEEAIKVIKDVGRKSGAILIFYNNNVNRLDITTGCWEIWQFNSINVYDWENLDAWVNIYYNYNKFVGWYAADNTLNKEIPNPDVGCYAFVGNIYNEAFVYRCDIKNQWAKTNQKAQHYIKVIFGDNVIIGDNGNWWQDGVDTNIPVSIKGDNGLTPYLRWSKNNQIEYSYDNINWYVLSDRFNTNIKIKDYVNTIDDLPNNIELGTIYSVGPVYAEDDVEQINPIYNIYVYTSNGWINNGTFNAIRAGVVQELGDSETEVMSQASVTRELNELASKLGLKIELRNKGYIDKTGTISNVDNFSYSDFISVSQGDALYLTGWSGSSSVANIVAYDNNKNFIEALSVGNGGIKENEKTIINEGVFYIIVSMANNKHTNYKKLCVYHIPIDNSIARQVDVDKLYDIVFVNHNIVFNHVGYISINDGSLYTKGTTFSTSDFIKVEEGVKIKYYGYTGSPLAISPIACYNNKKKYVSNLLEATYTVVNKEVVVPNNVEYIRVCAANDTHQQYVKPVVELISPVSSELNYKINELKGSVEILETANFKVIIDNLTAIDAGSAIWVNVLGAGSYFIESSTAPTEVAIYDGYGTSHTLIRTIKEFMVGDNIYSFDIEASDEEAGAVYIRITGTTSEIHCYKKTLITKINELEEKISHPLYGKKIAIIGDSISTIYNKNTPYIKIQNCDIGNTIQSYISYLDVYGTDTSSEPIPIGTTIGGVPLTAEMIGTLQSFTPTVDDVGKELGVAYNYNSFGTKVWSEVLCEKCGATLLANASFSGASMCSGQEGIWTFSHSFSPMTIGRCRTRDEEGNYINPDVIIIYRGTNDFSHTQGTYEEDGVTKNRWYSMLDDYNIDENGYPNTDIYFDGTKYRCGFRRAYYMTIKALRDTYPNAIIYICTLNVFKRVVYDRFPTRTKNEFNQYLYSLPEMNNVIRDIADVMGCGLIEFDKDGITFENCYTEGFITDNAEHPTHPNTKGHNVMAEKAIADITHTL